uniref:Lipoprotein n=1 Tax=candidate division WOR-3 bacterium TaxID=2052148 RepID=A0A7C4CE28_UNCW3
MSPTHLRLPLLLLSLSLFACSALRVERVDIAADTDDGSLSALTRFLPYPAGWAASLTEDCRVGNSTNRAGDTLCHRALYRFDISNWRDGDITLHLRCAASTGTPGAAEVICIDTFPTLPDTMSLAPGDISAWWNLAAVGNLVGTTHLLPNREFSAVIPESIVARRRAGGYLCFMIRLADETRSGNNWFRLVTSDYARAHATDKPHLTWKK